MPVKQLPVMKVDGKEYYVDDRLKELRQVDNPFEAISFEEFCRLYPNSAFILDIEP